MRSILRISALILVLLALVMPLAAYAQVPCRTTPPWSATQMHPPTLLSRTGPKHISQTALAPAASHSSWLIQPASTAPMPRILPAR